MFCLRCMLTILTEDGHVKRVTMPHTRRKTATQECIACRRDKEAVRQRRLLLTHL